MKIKEHLLFLSITSLFILFKINICFCMESFDLTANAISRTSTNPIAKTEIDSLISLNSPNSNKPILSVSSSNSSSAILSSSNSLSASSCSSSSSSASSSSSSSTSLNLATSKDEIYETLFPNSLNFEIRLSNLVNFLREQYYLREFEKIKSQKIFFERDLEKILREDGIKLRVIGIFGPRQSGKTTLTKKVFEGYIYVSLDDLDSKKFAEKDPKGFLSTYTNSKGLIVDEIQNVPELVSYIRGFVDDKYRPGWLVLVGSQSFLLNEQITESLAGRLLFILFCLYRWMNLNKKIYYQSD